MRKSNPDSLPSPNSFFKGSWQRSNVTGAEVPALLLPTSFTPLSKYTTSLALSFLICPMRGLDSPSRPHAGFKAWSPGYSVIQAACSSNPSSAARWRYPTLKELMTFLSVGFLICKKRRQFQPCKIVIKSTDNVPGLWQTLNLQCLLYFSFASSKTPL